MITTRLVQARRLFNSDLVPAEVNRANRLAWTRQIRKLGTHWQIHPKSTFVSWLVKDRK